MRPYRRSASICFSIALLSCAAADPPPAAVAEPDSTSLEPESSEWIFVTDGVGGGRKGECGAVPKWLAGEERCKGSLCGHGAALGKDWMRLCKPVTPELVAEVEQGTGALAKKARAAPAPCESQIAPILRNGCGDRKDCGEYAQAWATRCAEWSTPLVVRILEIAVQRASGDRFKIDARGCKDMLGEVVKAATCDQQFKCQDLFPVIEDYRGHCVPEGKLPPMEAAIAELSIRVGAAQNPDPMPVMAPGPKLDPTLTPLPLEDGRGAVLMVCGKRVPDVPAYLAARKECGEDVVVARVFEEGGAPVLRAGHLAHPSDKAFHEWFPSLVVEGEVSARFDAMLPGFVASLKQVEALAADSKQSRKPLQAFIKVLLDNQDAARNSKVFDAAFREHDQALVPLFRALGKEKKAVINDQLSPGRFAAAMRRADAYPLADVDAEGRVKLGNWSPASSVDLEDMLPKSMAAYREVLAPRFKNLAGMKPMPVETDRLSMAADGHSSRCGQAAKRYVETEQALLACLFAVTPCDEVKVTGLVKQLDQARRDEESFYTQSELAITSLPEGFRQGPRTAAEMGGCKEPWW